MEQHLQDLKDELTLLLQAQKDNDSSGALSRIRIGDKDMFFVDITTRIRKLREAISLMEINNAW